MLHKVVHEFNMSEEHLHKVVHEFNMSEEHLHKVVHAFNMSEEHLHKVVHEFKHELGATCCIRSYMSSNMSEGLLHTFVRT